MFSKETLYFEEYKRENTEKVLEQSIKKAEELSSRTLLLPSTTGYSAEMVLDMTEGKDLNVVIVGHNYGFKEPGKNEMEAKTIERIKKSNAQLLFTTHAFSALEKSFSKPYGGMYPHRIIADTLRVFSQGTKVLMEDMVMAADAGMVPIHEWIVSTGGKGRGLDTSMIIKTVHSDEFFKAKIKETICFPIY